MAYPRRHSGSVIARPRRTSSEEDIPSQSDSSLAPPRPFFLGAGQRSSTSSVDNSDSVDPASESDKDAENQITITRRTVATRKTARKRSDIQQPESTSNSRRSSLQADTPPTPSALFTKQLPSRPPPSSFAFPFQAYPGNPDPGLSIPGRSSRRRQSFDTMQHQQQQYRDSSDAEYHALPHTGSLTDLRKPLAPFMGVNNSNTLPRSASSNSIYKGSAAANMMSSQSQSQPTATEPPISPSSPTIPRNSSVHSFRAPFLSPASRPSSSLWAPPQYTSSIPLTATATASPSASTTALALAPGPGPSPFATAISKPKPPLPSTRLAAPIHSSEKPWLAKPEPRARLSYLLTLLFLILGLGGAAVLCFRGIAQVDILDPNSLCLVLSDDFSSSSLDDATWTPDVELGGFGNGEFEMTTDDPDNLYVANGELYLMPTFTSDKVPNTLNGGNFTLSGCTSPNKTACSVTSNAALGKVINPVQSARITTQGKKSIKFGKVEVRAKLPTGDWLWPAIWMLPSSSPYGSWPTSGEIDILESRGNPPSYPQGNNVVRSTLTYGPFPALLHQIYGWFSIKRSPSPNPAIGAFAAGFHTYTLEWTEEFMRFSVDSKLHAMLLTETKPHTKHNTYWDKAGFPLTARNSSDGSGPQVVVENPYEIDGATRAAPFDQSFYLIIDLAVGGTSGWFPDGKGGKPWFDGSLTAMRDFARAQDTWGATWPASAEDRAFRIDYVKMWEKCK